MDWWIFGGAWLANPLIWTSAVAALLACRRVTAGTAGAAIALGVPALARFGSVIAAHPGYWFWMGSAVLLGAASCLRWRPSRDLTPERGPLARLAFPPR